MLSIGGELRQSRDSYLYSSNQMYIFSNPPRSSREGFKLSFSAIKRLSEFRRALKGPGNLLDRIPLPGTDLQVSPVSLRRKPVQL